MNMCLFFPCDSSVVLLVNRVSIPLRSLSNVQKATMLSETPQSAHNAKPGRHAAQSHSHQPYVRLGNTVLQLQHRAHLALQVN